ncbi:SWIM zinc finger family protein [Streptomyces sp. NPDC005962]|uniref:SWIM zinc finger family protein n=1 Tax=Streptomyces sp. NPDC005962 TaxID=3154466 RepID=UPI0033FB1F0A
MSTAPYIESDVRQLAGSRSYERGLGYLDAVGPLRVEKGRVTATVEGTERYRVVLDDSRGLRAACDCPYGEEGHFCKHCVAVALTALREEAAARETALDAWLDGLGRHELLALVRERLAEDPDFTELLSLRATMAGGDTTSIQADISVLLDPAASASTDTSHTKTPTATRPR